MRVIGLILVMLGGLVLGYQGLSGSFESNGIWPGTDGQAPSGGISSVPPVISGIVVVSGLLLLASGKRNED
jgi:hypothetical protein